ncbi:hypothetical protein VTG60DRAFT_3865 [Thermothelomyces hinnuleus]
MATLPQRNNGTGIGAEFLSEFHFEIHYKKGKENVRADALSRRTDHTKKQTESSAPLLVEWKDGVLQHTRQPSTEDDPLELFKECYVIFREERIDEAKYQATPGPKVPKGVKERDKKLWYHGKAYIHKRDKQTEMIRELHESKLGGHKGITKIIAQVRRHYDFPQLNVRVKEVVQNCNICNRSKTARHKPYGLL